MTHRILAIDTSTDTGSVAIVEDGRVLAECTALVRAQHSEALMPLVEFAFARSGVTLAEIGMLAVGVGPGSFTGVRIGLATAKGIRMASGLPLVGVSSLDALAAAAVGFAGPIATVLDGKRGEVFARAWRLDRLARQPLGDAVVGRPEAVAQLIGGAFSGDAFSAIGDVPDDIWARWRTTVGSPTDVLPRVAGSPLARFVAHCAATGVYPRDDDDSLEPQYVRGIDALTLEQQRHRA